MVYNDVIEKIGTTIDAAGVVVIVAGAAIAFVACAVQLARHERDVYRRFRQRLGQTILLGLELLVAGDIVRTVAATPTLKSVAILGGIVLISYLLARQHEQPCEVVVLSLADRRQARLSALELLLGAGSNISKFPVAPQPDHDIGAAAEHRMNLAVRHLRMIGCQASGFISDDDVVTAVRTETRVQHYDRVILATGRQPGSWLARALRREPAHRLRPRLGQRLITFPLGPGLPHPTPASSP
jgi:uncharacterized membrane protein